MNHDRRPTPTRGARYPFAERRSTVIIRRGILLVGALLLPLFAISSYRAYVQIKSLTLVVPDSALRAGATVQAGVVSWARTFVELKLELIQGNQVDTLAIKEVPRNRDPVLDFRPRRDSVSATISRKTLGRLTTGPALLRATARGSMQWLREPPPMVRQRAVTIESGLRGAPAVGAQAAPAYRFDHVWLVVRPGAPERAALEAAGFRVAPGVNRHDGQGTASVTIEFMNAYLELIWPDSSVPVTPGREAAVRRFIERMNWRSTGAAPIGIRLKRAPGTPDSLPFPTWSVHVDWMPPGMAYEILTPRNDTLTPSISFSPRGYETPLVSDPPSPETDPVRRTALDQPFGVRRVTAVRIEMPPTYQPTEAMGTFTGLGAVAVGRGDRWLLELTLDDGARGRTLDFRPQLPLVLHL